MDPLLRYYGHHDVLPEKRVPRYLLFVKKSIGHTSQNIRCVELWCSLFRLPDHAVEEIVEWPFDTHVIYCSLHWIFIGYGETHECQWPLSRHCWAANIRAISSNYTINSHWSVGCTSLSLVYARRGTSFSGLCLHIWQRMDDSLVVRQGQDIIINLISFILIFILTYMINSILRLIQVIDFHAAGNYVIFSTSSISNLILTGRPLQVRLSSSVQQ